MESESAKEWITFHTNHNLDMNLGESYIPGVTVTEFTHISSDNEIVLYSQFTIFRSRRLHASFADTLLSLELNICCGRTKDDGCFWDTFEMVKEVIAHNVYLGKDPFSGMDSFSHIKPIWKDNQYMKKLNLQYYEALKFKQTLAL